MPWADLWDRRVPESVRLTHHPGHPADDLLDFVSLLTLVLMVAAAVGSTLSVVVLALEHFA